MMDFYEWLRSTPGAWAPIAGVTLIILAVIYKLLKSSGIE